MKQDKSHQIQDRRSVFLTALKYVLLTIGAVVMLFPFLWMLLTSLKTLPEAISIPPKWMPSDPQWKNYDYAWNGAPKSFKSSLASSSVFAVVTKLMSIPLILSILS